MLFRVYARIYNFLCFLEQLVKEDQKCQEFRVIMSPPAHTSCTNTRFWRLRSLCSHNHLYTGMCLCISCHFYSGFKCAKSSGPGLVTVGSGVLVFLFLDVSEAHIVIYTGVCFTCAKRLEVECAGGFCFAFPEGHTRTRAKTLQIVKQKIC